MDMCSSCCQCWCLQFNSGVSCAIYPCVLLPILQDPCSTPEAWPWFMCVHMECVSGTCRLQCCYHICLKSELCATYSMYCRRWNFLKCTHHMFWGGPSLVHTRSHEGWGGIPSFEQCPAHMPLFLECHFLNIKWLFTSIISRCHDVLRSLCWVARVHISKVVPFFLHQH
jgi:hypothetical protein